MPTRRHLPEESDLQILYTRYILLGGFVVSLLLVMNFLS